MFNNYNTPADTTPMKNYFIKECKKCHSPLRIPADIGGMLMRCPNCGYEFHTDFKLAQQIKKGEDVEKSNRETPAKRPPSTFSITV